MSIRAISRVRKELALMLAAPLRNISCSFKDGSNYLCLSGVIIGPNGTPYAGGTFQFEIEIPSEYPFVPPKLRFLTKIYHPNIDENGRVCLHILDLPPYGTWQCTFGIYTVLLNVLFLMANPNPLDPMVPEIADVFFKNKKLFHQRASNWTKMYAEHKCEDNECENNDPASQP